MRTMKFLETAVRNCHFDTFCVLVQISLFLVSESVWAESVRLSAKARYLLKKNHGDGSRYATPRLGLFVFCLPCERTTGGTRISQCGEILRRRLGSSALDCTCVHLASQACTSWCFSLNHGILRRSRSWPIQSTRSDTTPSLPQVSGPRDYYRTALRK